MSTTVVREKRQVTLPQEVVQAAGIKVDDQVDWRFEDGEIRGKKLEPEPACVLDLQDLDPTTLALKEGKPSRESIVNPHVSHFRTRSAGILPAYTVRTA